MLVKSWLSSVIKSNRICPNRTSRRLLNKRAASQGRSLEIEKLEDRVVLSAVTPVLIGNDIVFDSFDAVADLVIFSVDGSGQLQHNLGGTGGFNSNVDLDSATAGDQTRLVSDITSLTYTDTGNNDTVSFAGGNSFNFNNAGFTEISVTARNIVMNSGSSITTVDGDITFSANQAATPASGDFVGIDLNDADITSTNGDILLEGRGGNEIAVGSGFNHGIFVRNSSQVRSIGTTKADAATITMNGIGGDGEFCCSHGVFVYQAGSKVSSVAGDIEITGEGATNTQFNLGVVLDQGGGVESTGTTKADAASITIDGSGGNGIGFTHGVLVANVGTKVSSVTGDISITGQGGYGNGNANVGVWLLDGGVVESTGTTKADAATITINGIGGNVDGTDSNYGVLVSGAGSQVISSAGNISIIGQGGGNGTGTLNIGAGVRGGGVVESTGTSKADAATITINGTGGNGNSYNYGVNVEGFGRVTSTAGDISIHGQGGGNGTGIENRGVLVDNSVVESIGTSKADAATITINGTGGNGIYFNYGVLVDHSSSAVRSEAGDITIIGQGNGIGNFNVGVFVANGAIVESTGTTKADAATITINGTGGDGTGNNYGVYVVGSGSAVRSEAGDIEITGQGGYGNGNANVGVLVQSGGVVESTGITKVDAATITINGTGGDGTAGNWGTDIDGASIVSSAGNIRIDGQGGNGSGVNNHGTLITGGAVVESTGTVKADAATITVNGTGGSGTVNLGVEIRGFGAGTRVASVAGDILIAGTGGVGGNSNRGVQVWEGGLVESTGISKVDAAKITISGNGGNGTTNNFGVFVVNSGSSVSSSTGNILITGQGGGDGTGAGNHGVIVFAGGAVESIGTSKVDAATITINGTGGSGTNFNTGVIVWSAGARVSSIAGDISITGTGGNGGSVSLGVWVVSGAVVESTGTSISDAAAITIDGTGGNGTDVNWGVSVQDSGARVSSVVADISITGQGGGTGNSQYGVLVGAGGGVVESTGTGSNDGGNINILGTAGTGNGIGVAINGASAVTSDGGDIDVTGTGSGGEASIQATGIDAGSGVVTLTAPTGFIQEALVGTDIAGGTVNLNGEISPAGPGATGQLVIDGDVASLLASGYFFELNGLTVGSNYDQLQVIGADQTVDLDGATLNVSLGFTPAAGDEFVIIDNVDSTSVVSGTFNGLAEGDVLTVGTTSFRITYQGGTDNNDVVLTVVTATISGTVFVDANGNGVFDGGSETGIDGVTVELLDSGGAVLATDVTELGGVYAFEVSDALGTYRIREIQPTGVDDGAAILGDADGNLINGEPADGTVLSSNEMQLTLTGINATDYDFTEMGQAVQGGDTATIGFWQNKNGRALIEEGGDALVDWLNDNFGNVFGSTFSDGSGGDDAAEVASFYKTEFFKKKLHGTSKVDAQFMSTALATFFTSSNLSVDSAAANYGFNVTEAGLGSNVVNVGSNGAAFGVADNSDMTVMSLLLATNNFTDIDGATNNDDDGYSHVYDANGDGILDADELALRAMANDLYSWINESGDI